MIKWLMTSLMVMALWLAIDNREASGAQAQGLWPLNNCPYYLDFSKEPPEFTKRKNIKTPPTIFPDQILNSKANHRFHWAYRKNDLPEFYLHYPYSSNHIHGIYNQSGDSLPGSGEMKIRGSAHNNTSWVLPRKDHYIAFHTDVRVREGLFYSLFDPEIKEGDYNHKLSDEFRIDYLEVVHKKDNTYWLIFTVTDDKEIYLIPFNIKDLEAGEKKTYSIDHLVDEPPSETYEWHYEMEFSHDRETFVLAVLPDAALQNNRLLYQFNFNPETGEIGFERELLEQRFGEGSGLGSGILLRLTGITFSPRDSFLYVPYTQQPGTRLVQFNLHTGEKQEVYLGPEELYDKDDKDETICNESINSIQLGINGRLYLSYCIRHVLEFPYPDRAFNDGGNIYSRFAMSCSDIMPDNTVSRGRNPLYFPSKRLPHRYLNFRYQQKTCNKEVTFRRELRDGFEEFAGYQWYFHDKKGNVLDSAKGKETMYEFPDTGRHYIRLRALDKYNNSQWFSDTIKVKLPDPLDEERQDIQRVSVSEGEKVEIEWPESAYPGILERREKGDYRVVDTFHRRTTGYVDTDASPSKGPVSYRMKLHDACGNEGEAGRKGRTIYPEGTVEENNRYAGLAWTQYREWREGVEKYQIKRRPLNSDKTFRLLEETKTDTTLRDKEFFSEENSGGVCYRITALSQKNNQKSHSPELCLPYHAVVWVPNAISLRPTAVNDEFMPVTYGVKDYEMIIYNRWGSEIFRTTNSKEGWDGRQEGEYVPEGTYLYHIKAIGYYGRHINRSGSINVLR